MRQKLFNSFAEALLSTEEGRKLFHRTKRKLKRQRRRAKFQNQDNEKNKGYEPLIFDWMEE